MTEYKMTDEWRKLLTEKLLGECWQLHFSPRTMAGYVCEKCGDYIKWGHGYDENGNHTFTTMTDRQAVLEKIRDAGKWREFSGYCYFLYRHGVFIQEIDSRISFIEWLFLDNLERACCLAAIFLEEQG